MENYSGDALGERLGKSVSCVIKGNCEKTENEPEPGTGKGGWFSEIWDKLGKRETREVGALREAGEKIGQSTVSVLSKLGLEIVGALEVDKGHRRPGGMTNCFPGRDRDRDLGRKPNADLPIVSLDKFEMKDEIRALNEELKRMDEEEKRTGRKTGETFPQIQELNTGDVVTRTSEGELVIRFPDGESLEVSGREFTLRDAFGNEVANESLRYLKMPDGKSFVHTVPFNGPGWYNIVYPNGDYIDLRSGGASGYRIQISRGSEIASLTTRK